MEIQWLFYLRAAFKCKTFAWQSALRADGDFPTVGLMYPISESCVLQYICPNRWIPFTKQLFNWFGSLWRQTSGMMPQGSLFTFTCKQDPEILHWFTSNPGRATCYLPVSLTLGCKPPQSSKDHHSLKPTEAHHLQRAENRFQTSPYRTLSSPCCAFRSSSWSSQTGPVTRNDPYWKHNWLPSCIHPFSVVVN